MPLTYSTQKPPTVQHIQWDGTNTDEIAALLAGPEPFGWTVEANGDVLALSGGAHGDTMLPLDGVLVGRPYWGDTAPEFALAEILTDAEFRAKYGS